MAQLRSGVERLKKFYIHQLAKSKQYHTSELSKFTLSELQQIFRKLYPGRD